MLPPDVPTFSWANRIGASVAIAMLTGIYAVIAIQGRPPEEKGFFVWDLLPLAIVLGAHLFFVRPELQAQREQLVIKNPLRRIEIPWPSISEAKAEDKHIVVFTPYGKYRAFALEVMNWELLFGVGSQASRAAAAITEYAGHLRGGDSPPRPRTTWRLPSTGEVALVLIWIILLASVWLN